MRLLRISRIVLLLLVLGAGAAHAGRLPCPEIISKVNRLEKRADMRTIDARRVGRRIGQDTQWVARCLSSYGRRYKISKSLPGDSGDMTQWESREANEQEERAPEEELGYVPPQRPLAEKRPGQRAPMSPPQMGEEDRDTTRPLLDPRFGR